MQLISVTILTKNSEKYLHDVLYSLRNFSEVIILDSGSCDNTIKIAQSYNNVIIYYNEFLGFGKMHNLATSNASYDWVLSVDADEVLEDDLINEIADLTLDQSCVYALKRKNYYHDKWIKYCGWYPDYQLRLYNRKITSFNNAEVSEKIIVKHDMHTIYLNHALRHYSYDSIDGFIDKIKFYSNLFAKEYENLLTAKEYKNLSTSKNKWFDKIFCQIKQHSIIDQASNTSLINQCINKLSCLSCKLCNIIKSSISLFQIIIRAKIAFFKVYIIKRGILSGVEGFLIAFMAGFANSIKYLKRYEIKKKHQNMKNRK